MSEEINETLNAVNKYFENRSCEGKRLMDYLEKIYNPVCIKKDGKTIIIRKPLRYIGR